jgi:predicted TIM-barrel enzyme
VSSFLAAADAVIVGTALKEDGVTWNRVDAGRARAFVRGAAEGGLWEPRHEPAGLAGR